MSDYKERIEAESKARAELVENLKAKKAELEVLLEKVNDHWMYEDYVYRFYHQSFKVYGLQDLTMEMVKALKELCPSRRFHINPYFEEIYNEGTGKKFTMEANKRWLYETRPIVEAFLHAKYFLEMAVKYAGIEDVTSLPSGWAGLLYFYQLR